MGIMNETDLNQKEKLVLEKYSEKPWRPEELSKLLKKTMSRPTFYRAHRLLSCHYGEADKPGRCLKSPLIYVISDEEKRQYGLIYTNGDLLNGKFYFHKDKTKSQRWVKIMQKIRDYNGKDSPYHLLTIVQKEFGGYPLISADDIIEMARFHRKIPEGNRYNDEVELFKFLEPQIRRLNPLFKEDERRRVSIALREVFDLCTKDLLGATQVSDTKLSKESFDILCHVYREVDARELVKSLFLRNADSGKELTGVKARLISDITKVFTEHFDKTWIITFLNSKISELSDREIEISFEDPKEVGKIVGLRNGLIETLRELSSN